MIKAWLDLTRAHFAPAWPTIFCAGLMLGFANYGGFSWALVIKAILIALFGFEAGFILNDYVDRNYDKKDIDNKLTRYFRPFGTRPIAEGAISPQAGLTLFCLLFILTLLLIFSLPFPNNLFVLAIMLYSYLVEYFYQVKKRQQNFPWAQLLGRTDFSLFMVAGYLCVGQPDLTALKIFLFFYPLALIHLAVNDFIDVKNDLARGMKSIPVLYGSLGTKLWISGFTLLHFFFAAILVKGQGTVMSNGFLIGAGLLLIVNFLVWQAKEKCGLIPLFLIHLTFLTYSVATILN